MTEEQREAICNARSNYAKRKIGALTSSELTEAEADDITAGQSSSNRRVKYADTSAAGDQMSCNGRNLIGQIRSGQQHMNVHSRTISSIAHSSVNPSARAELDSHADTTVAGSSCRILELTEHSCDVFPFTDRYEPVELQKSLPPTITP
jgi:small nuclear ribonucleoprotein (snRNP)-like protein